MKIIAGLPPEAKEGEYVSLDTEFYRIPKGKLHRPVGEFACLSVCLERDSGQLHGAPEPTVYQIYDPDDVGYVLKRLERGKWIFQNAKFDLRQLRRWADIPPRRIWDTMIVEQGLFGGYYSHFDLASLALRYLDFIMDKETREEFFTGSEMTPEMTQYAALDAVITLHVAQAQIRYVQENHITMDHYWLADHPALWAILDMAPVRMNVDGWHRLSQEFLAKKEAVAARHPEINLGSTQQVNRQLCEMLHIRPLKSTDEATLLELKDRCAAQGKDTVIAFIDDVLAYRTAQKASSTYGDNWLEKYIEDGYVWADFKPVQALTGRMACGDPNLQNIPSRDYPVFRTLFVASPAHCLLIGDVAQQEPRILAKLSGDPSLTDALCHGVSPHILVGQRLFGDPNFSKKDPRYIIAKGINLGLSYGLTPFGLAQRVGIDPEEAEEIIATYFRAFPLVRTYIENYRTIAHRQGYVSTMLGRRAFVNPYIKKWENNAINSPIQGTAGDQIKMAMGFLHQETANARLPFCLSMVIHDEMVCDVPVEILPDYERLVQEAWDYAGKKTLGDTIPMVVEIATGDHWGCKI